MSGSYSPADKAVAPEDAGDEQEGRTARLCRDADGDPLGSVVFLDADELRELGIDPDGANERVRYVVTDGMLILGGGGGEQGGAGE